VVAGFDDLAAFEHQDLVRVCHRRQAVGHHQGGAAAAQAAQGGLDRRFGTAVERAGGFVEDQEAWLRQQARARPTRWRSPPDSFSPRSPTLVSRPSGRLRIKAPSSAWSAAPQMSSSLASGRPKPMLTRRCR